MARQDFKIAALTFNRPRRLEAAEPAWRHSVPN
jgi:hypothetical protein